MTERRRRKETGETSLLSPERAALCETGLSSCWLAENSRAAGADDDGLCVGEDGGDGEAAGALDIHEEGSRSRDKVLELVLASLSGWGRVQEIDGENHLDDLRSVGACGKVTDGSFVD